MASLPKYRDSGTRRPLVPLVKRRARRAGATAALVSDEAVSTGCPQPEYCSNRPRRRHASEPTTGFEESAQEARDALSHMQISPDKDFDDSVAEVTEMYHQTRPYSAPTEPLRYEPGGVRAGLLRVALRESGFVSGRAGAIPQQPQQQHRLRRPKHPRRQQQKQHFSSDNILARRRVEHEREDSSSSSDWNVRFFSAADDVSGLTGRHLRPWQRINQFPGDQRAIGHKDRLGRHVTAEVIRHGSLFAFIPPTFTLPGDKIRWQQFLRRRADGRNTSIAKALETRSHLEEFWARWTPPPLQQGQDIWIVKPVSGSQGRGIRLMRTAECRQECQRATERSRVVAQLYVHRPLLLGGYKFDLRLYVAVAAYHPLHAYIYEQGLVRFATEPFRLDDLSRRCTHLTNTSINHRAPGSADPKPVVGHGCRWALSRLRRELLDCRVDDRMLWQHVARIVVCTLLVQAEFTPRAPNSVQLLGFDVIVDADLAPWLLEVNRSPSLEQRCRLDRDIKLPMLKDFVKVMEFRPGDELCGRAPPPPTDGPPSWMPSRAATLQLEHDWRRLERQAREDAARAAQPGGRPAAACPRPPAVPKERPDVEPASAAAATPAHLHLPAVVSGASCPPLPMTCTTRQQAHRPGTRQCEAAQLPQLRHGGFVLVYPFNEATLRAQEATRDGKRLILDELYAATRDLERECAGFGGRRGAAPSSTMPEQRASAQCRASADADAASPVNRRGYPFAMHQQLQPGVLTGTWPGWDERASMQRCTRRLLTSPPTAPRPPAADESSAGTWQ